MRDLLDDTNLQSGTSNWDKQIKLWNLQRRRKL
jgi:hypothetical protein